MSKKLSSTKRQSSKIDALLEDLIRKEGGYVNHPNDKGGPTKYGITQGTLSAWLGRKASVADVQNLALQDAEEIYKANYYHKPKIDQLPDAIQPVVFDTAVNSGSGKAVSMLQEVLTKQGHELVADGVIGNMTIAAAEKSVAANAKALINAYCDRRKAFFISIAARNPSQKVFLTGWINRSNSFRQA